MNRRRFVQLSSTSSAALALTPAMLRWDGQPLGGVSPARGRAALDALRAEEPCRAEIRSERGGPRLFVNDEELVPLIGLSTSLLPTVENYNQMGFRIVQPQLGMASAWTGPGTYDFTRLEAYLGQVLALAPDAYFLPRVQLRSPIWWKEAHPDEVEKFGIPVPSNRYDVVRGLDLELGEGDHYFTNFYGEGWEASYASEVWRRETSDMLRAFVQFIEASPLVSRMMGYHFVHGQTEEWNMPGDDFLPGYSEPMKREVDVPEPRERVESSYGLLRDPAKERRVIDFYQRLHEVRAETIAQYAEVLKDEMDGRVLCGTFFGYLMEVPRMQESGHLAPLAALDSPHLDFVACPYTYQATNEPGVDRRESDLYDGAENWLGRARGVAGDGGFRAMLESLKRRGKLYISEIDPSTYLDVENRWRGIGGTGSTTQEGTLQILRRDLGNVFAMGVGGWLYDFGPHHNVETGWYGDEPIIKTVADIVELMQASQGQDIGSVAETVIVGDPASLIASKHWMASRPWPGQGIRYSDFFNHWFLNGQARSVYRIGSPVDLLYSFDLTRQDLEQYKLVLIPNWFLMDPDTVEDLHTKLKGSGATVVWYYAPGLLTPDGVDLDQMARLTGFSLRELVDPGVMMIQAKIPDGPEMSFGVMSPEYYSPRFAINDPESETLGTWAGRGGPAFARKTMDGWTSVYVGTAPLPVEILRWLAAEAGVESWADRPAIVQATRGAAMVVATEAGPHTVTLPVSMRTEDGEEQRREHQIELAFGDVRLFTSAEASPQAPPE